MDVNVQNMSLDDYANKDILTVPDVQYLAQYWPEPYPDFAAANLATRVQRAPQFCRFISFEKLNLVRLYQLQHRILTYVHLDEDDDSVLSVPAGEEMRMAPGSAALMTPATGPILPPTARTSDGRQLSVDLGDPGPSSSSQVMSSSSQMLSSSSQMMSSRRPMGLEDLRKPHFGLGPGGVPETPESLGLFNGKFDQKLSGLLKEYNEALTQFQTMQSWSRANATSTSLARSDFAFHFRNEKYITSSETMYDFSPSPQRAWKIDVVRQWLMKLLPLEYVNPNAWNERRTLKVPGLQRSATAASLRETREVGAYIDILARMVVAIAAGLFLLVPMIVLFFITSAKARLGTSVAFVILFAIVLAGASNATNDALMAATAAYAAVLVVFVGQTTTQ